MYLICFQHMYPLQIYTSFHNVYWRYLEMFVFSLVKKPLLTITARDVYDKKKLRIVVLFWPFSIDKLASIPQGYKGPSNGLISKCSIKYQWVRDLARPCEALSFWLPQHWCGEAATCNDAQINTHCSRILWDWNHAHNSLQTLMSYY